MDEDRVLSAVRLDEIDFHGLPLARSRVFWEGRSYEAHDLDYRAGRVRRGL
jgi:hypothetical protein